VAIKIVRLGSPRERDEGLRLGTVRRPPRGVRKEDYASKDFFELIKDAKAADDERSWSAFKKRFRAEMRRPDASKELDLLAALSHQTNMSLGCYCENEGRCHRSVLRELLIERGAKLG
jgi:uncharacterized protein YeaO (DUF488 family)